jgi:hypothetical protein
VIGAALAVPSGLVVLALVGHRPDPVYQGFLGVFSAQLGGDPLFLTLLASVGFYLYAALRRTPLAVEALTAVLLALVVVGPDTLNRGWFVAPQPAPLLAATALQLGFGLWQRSSWRSLVGAAGLVGVATLVLHAEPDAASLRGLITLHLALTAVLIVGAAFDDVLARLLRFLGAGLVLLACLGAVVFRSDPPAGLTPGEMEVYPLIMAALLAGYGWLLGHRPSLAVAGLVLTGWLTAAGWRGYCVLRQLVAGLDYLAVSLTLLALAILISLAKSGLRSRWLAARQGSIPPSVD